MALAWWRISDFSGTKFDHLSDFLGDLWSVILLSPLISSKSKSKNDGCEGAVCRIVVGGVD